MAEKMKQLTEQDIAPVLDGLWRPSWIASRQLSSDAPDLYTFLRSFANAAAYHAGAAFGVPKGISEAEARERERMAFIKAAEMFDERGCELYEVADEFYPSLSEKPRTVRLSDGRTYKHDHRDIDGSGIWLKALTETEDMHRGGRGVGWVPLESVPPCYTVDDFEQCAKLLRETEG